MGMIVCRSHFARVIPLPKHGCTCLFNLDRFNICGDPFMTRFYLFCRDVSGRHHVLRDTLRNFFNLCHVVLHLQELAFTAAHLNYWRLYFYLIETQHLISVFFLKSILHGFHLLDSQVLLLTLLQSFRPRKFGHYVSIE